MDIPAPRGSILDRNGEPLALSVPVASVSVNPQQIRKPPARHRSSGQYIEPRPAACSTAGWIGRVENHKGFLWVKRRIDPFETDRLKAMHLDWVTFHTESERHYPNGEVAAHVLGAVYKDEEGAAGVERALDNVLQGRDGSERLVDGREAPRPGFAHGYCAAGRALR